MKRNISCNVSAVKKEFCSCASTWHTFLQNERKTHRSYAAQKNNQLLIFCIAKALQHCFLAKHLQQVIFKDVPRVSIKKGTESFYVLLVKLQQTSAKVNSVNYKYQSHHLQTTQDIFS